MAMSCDKLFLDVYVIPQDEAGGLGSYGKYGRSN